MSASIASVAQNYGIANWGEGYFGINARGNVSVRPNPGRSLELDLFELARQLIDEGQRLPVLVRFDDILRHRVQSLCAAFQQAATALDYAGGYRAVYPIKVNQQRSVIEQLVAGGGECVGLEAGSKPELMAVLASSPPGGTVVCNGYKDRQYVRLALIGQRMGLKVYIVIEKLSELDIVLAEAADLQVQPLLGVRVRLAAIATGKWQNSGGAKSKFGLSAAQVLTLVRGLHENGCVHWLVLLHAHIGSQIPDLSDIHRGVREIARYFVELRGQGAPIAAIDVGGGLGIDYEGSRSEHEHSMNYDLDAYASEVLRPLARACAEYGLPQPAVFSESGRAMTAHHAVLIADVIERESPDAVPVDEAEADDDDELVDRMRKQLKTQASPPQRFHNARALLAQVHERFAQGDLGLAARAHAESLFYAITRAAKRDLRLASRRHRELLEQLNETLAERVFGNFSLFQSLPDAWAIDQVFPVVPLHRLHESPDQASMVHDLTCDSDGCIGSYVDQDGIENTLMLHAQRPGEPYLLGVFLVGAYQEILGDMHNLFGDTDAVNVSVGTDGRCRIAPAESGDSVDELLRYVHFDPETMLTTYRERLIGQGLSADELERDLIELTDALDGYTYLQSDIGN